MEQLKETSNEQTKKEKKPPANKTAIICLIAVIAICAAVSLFCLHLITSGQESSEESSSDSFVQSSIPVNPPAVTDVTVDYTDISDNGGIKVIIKTENADEYYFGTAGTAEEIPSDGWQALSGDETTLYSKSGEYCVFVRNSSATAGYKENITIDSEGIKAIEITNPDPYINVGMTYTLTAELTAIGINDETVKWESSDESVISVSGDKATAVGAGNATITATSSNGLTDTFEMTSTDLLLPPQIIRPKTVIPAGQYTEEEGELLDNILFSRVEAAGGEGTRGAVVAAARFLTLELPYKIPYFFENGRLGANPGMPVCDGEGRFYHKGLYLTKSKYDILDQDKIINGPGTWGELIYCVDDLGNGKYRPNGLDCSGFVAWVFMNGGVPLGDVGAGDFPQYDYEFSDYGTKVELTNELMASDIVQVGDMIGTDGHIAVIIGLDEEKIYIAESFRKGLTVNVQYRQDGVVNHEDYSYVLLMDEVYEQFNGQGIVTDMWEDYSGGEYAIGD